MMDDDGTLVPARGVTHPAPLAVSIENGLTQTAKVLLILPLERVTGRAKTHGEDLTVPAPAMQRAL